MTTDPTHSRPRWHFPTLLLGLLLVVVIGLLIARRQRPVIPAPALKPAADVFTAIPPDTLPIAWNSWSLDSFAAARTRGVPVAALLTASWCESCILYEGALAVRADVRAHLERDVVAVRADIDRRPDVNARYRDDRYALPTWIFLSPTGELWDIADAPRPDVLARLLDELVASPRAGRRDPGLQALSPPPRPPSPHLDEHPARIQADLVAAWPAPEAALEATTPLLDGEALGFLAVRTRTFFLDGMRRVATLADPSCGCIEQDFEPVPGRVQRALFLETHAMLLEHFTTAWEMTHDSTFARAADGIVRWTQATLFDAPVGLFRAAQGTLVMHEGRPAVTSGERARVTAHAGALEPHAPDVYPSSGNARMAAAAARWGKLRGDDTATAHAHAVLAKLQLGATPLPPHDWAREGDRIVASPHRFLRDGAELGLALLAADKEHLAAARRIADAMLEDFAAPNGAFADVADSVLAPERMRIRMTPLADNARAAQFLIALADLTSEVRYAAAAQRALEAWSLAVRSESPWAAAAFGNAVLALATTPPTLGSVKP